jgi:hypothetical protein
LNGNGHFKSNRNRNRNGNGNGNGHFKINRNSLAPAMPSPLLRVILVLDALPGLRRLRRRTSCLLWLKLRPAGRSLAARRFLRWFNPEAELLPLRQCLVRHLVCAPVSGCYST